MNNWVIWELCVWVVWEVTLIQKLVSILPRVSQNTVSSSVVIWAEKALSLMSCHFFFVMLTTKSSHFNLEHFTSLLHLSSLIFFPRPMQNGRMKKNNKNHVNLLKFCHCLMTVFTINRINWLKASVNLSEANWWSVVFGFARLVWVDIEAPIPQSNLSHALGFCWDLINYQAGHSWRTVNQMLLTYG